MAVLSVLAVDPSLVLFRHESIAHELIELCVSVLKITFRKTMSLLSVRRETNGSFVVVVLFVSVCSDDGRES